MENGGKVSWSPVNLTQEGGKVIGVAGRPRARRRLPVASQHVSGGPPVLVGFCGRGAASAPARVIYRRSGDICLGRGFQRVALSGGVAYSQGSATEHIWSLDSAALWASLVRSANQRTASSTVHSVLCWCSCQCSIEM
ncbi:hypothetical protein DPEC_G00211190 [Dallia pectoralis]|uniref:Uncharacterized protein n=1 Tax=Dallia pectoralis TaxID=75939 RepID=A0ACC2G6E1_DALPE|nr:hypothetical protein DPEC_G00211190 [Dallia pectoralis]